MEDIEKYINFIKIKYGDKRCKNGMLYYERSIQIKQMIEKYYPVEFQITGLLYDLVNNTDTTFEELENITSKYVLKVIKILYKSNDCDLFEYYSRIYINAIARVVKIVDSIFKLREINNYECLDEDYIQECNDYILPLAVNIEYEDELNYEYNKVKELISDKSMK